MLIHGSIDSMASFAGADWGGGGGGGGRDRDRVASSLILWMWGCIGTSLGG